MRRPAHAQTVGTQKCLSDQQARGLCDVGAQHGLHGSAPPLARCGAGAVVREVVVGGADDAKTRKVVAHAQRDEALDLRVLLQPAQVVQEHIARRHIHMKHPGHDELHGAALGPHHQVHARQVALQGALHLRLRLQDDTKHRQAQGQQNQVEHRRQRP